MVLLSDILSGCRQLVRNRRSVTRTVPGRGCSGRRARSGTARAAKDRVDLSRLPTTCRTIGGERAESSGGRACVVRWMTWGQVGVDALGRLQAGAMQSHRRRLESWRHSGPAIPGGCHAEPQTPATEPAPRWPRHSWRVPCRAADAGWKAGATEGTRHKKKRPGQRRSHLRRGGMPAMVCRTGEALAEPLHGSRGRSPSRRHSSRKA